MAFDRNTKLYSFNYRQHDAGSNAEVSLQPDPAESFERFESLFAPKGLLEFALLLSATPQENLEEAFAELTSWHQLIKEEDQQLGIQRHSIPRALVWLPKTPQGREFFELAKSIGDIARPQTVKFNTCLQKYPLEWHPGIGDNISDHFSEINFDQNSEEINLRLIKANKQFFNQVCHLKTQQFYWQAKGILFAYEYLKSVDSTTCVIPDPVAEDGIISDHLPEESIDALKKDVKIDLACFNLISQGWDELQSSHKQGLHFPFANPQELFLETLKENFQTSWDLGPLNIEHQWLSKAKQENYINARQKLLSDEEYLGYSPRNGSEAKNCKKIKEKKYRHVRKSFGTAQQEFLEFLKNGGWSERWLLAFYEMCRVGEIDCLWESYVKAVHDGKSLFISEILWRDGLPYKSRAGGPDPIKARVHPNGYTQWNWLKES